MDDDRVAEIAGAIATIAFLIALGLGVYVGVRALLEERPVAPDIPPQQAHNAKIIIAAARRHGLDPVLLLAISHIETAGTLSHTIRPRRPNGKPIGTARGLFQFIRDTAAKYGLAHDADAEDQADAGAVFTKDNMVLLSAALGRPATPGEIYLAHFLGAPLALKVIRAPADRPRAKVIPRKVVNANRFLRRFRTVGEVRSWARRKMAAAMATWRHRARLWLYR